MFGLGVIIFVIAFLSFRNNFIFVSSVFFLALILGALSLKNSYMQHKCHINNFVTYDDDTVYSLSGFVDSDPEIKDKQISFVFRTQEVQVNNLKWPCCGKVLVKVDFSQGLDYADSLILQGNLRRPYGFSSGSYSYRDYLSRQGIYLVMHIKNSLQIIPQFNKGGSRLIIFSLWLRARMEGPLADICRIYLRGYFLLWF